MATMKAVRNLIRRRWLGGTLALSVAYVLAIQAVMASVGLGMSAASASGQTDFVICSFAPGPSSNGPATNNDQNAPGHRPQCPFCFVAAQSAGHLATIGEVTFFPAYARLQVTDALYGHFGDRGFVLQFRRTVGDPRAPPSFSV